MPTIPVSGCGTVSACCIRPVESALSIDGQVAGQTGRAILEQEHRASEAFQALRKALPVVPGYTVPWQANRGDFGHDLLCAGTLLKDRYGLSHACLKPSDGGNGGRIVPKIDLQDSRRLEELATNAWKLGGDQVLEAHVSYFERHVGGEPVLTTPSAHVRAGSCWMGSPFNSCAAPHGRATFLSAQRTGRA